MRKNVITLLLIITFCMNIDTSISESNVCLFFKRKIIMAFHKNILMNEKKMLLVLLVSDEIIDLRT